MNMKAILPLGLAMVLAVVAIFGVRSAISHRGTTVAQSTNLVTVVVAKQGTDPGQELTAADLTVAKVPADAAPGQVFSSPDQLVGRVVMTPLVKGQAILETLLAPAGTGGGLQALVPAGMRAVTIEVSEFTGVGGMLEPGCRVDLVSVLRGDEKTHESVAKTIMQNVKVTAVGRSVTPIKPVEGQPLPPPTNSVTLLVTPKQVQQLELASISGRPWLVLRSGKDGQEVNLDGTSLAELRGDPAGDNTADMTAQVPTSTVPVVPAVSTTDAPPTSQRRTIIIIQGGVESQVTYMAPLPRTTTVDTNPNEMSVPGNR